MFAFQIALHIEEWVHTTPGLKSGGEGVRDHCSQKGQKWLKKKSGHPKILVFGLRAFAWKLPQPSSPNGNKTLGAKH